jgi:hypothetical protein
MLSNNMSLTAFWFAMGKSHARDGKPEAFVLNENQLRRYTAGERDAAAKSYRDGYAFGLPEPEQWTLTVTKDRDCVEFRLNGVLLERTLALAAQMGLAYIPVLRAIRRFHPDLHDFNTARELWKQAARTGLVYTPQVGKHSIDERVTA